jgi:hypothetical protein
MTGRGITAAALAMIVAMATSLAQTSYGWSDVDCGQSRIVAPQGATCQATNVYTGRDAAGGAGRRHLVRSDSPQGWSLIVISEAVDTGAYIATRTATVDYLKALDKRVIDGSDWSAGTTDGSIQTYTFRSTEGEACVGFRKVGEARSTGHDWLMHGLRCLPKGHEMSPAEIGGFIDSARVR